MVKKLIIYAFTLFQSILFLACGGPGPENNKGGLVEISLPEGIPYSWSEYDGFFPHSDHLYGFDRHTKPRAGIKEDSIVHLSVLNGKNGAVTLRINKGLYEYYICSPENPNSTVENINNSNAEQRYVVTAKDNVKEIALCRTRDGVSQIAQRLHVHPYEQKTYDFLAVYIDNGKSGYDENELVVKEHFWKDFSKAYKQALVYNSSTLPIIKHSMGNIIKTDIETGKAIGKTAKTVLYVRMRGVYDDECLVGDVEKIRLEVFKEIKDAKNNYPNRVILQLGLPTKRFWPLEKDDDGNIVVCGRPDEVPSIGKDYEIIPVGDDCSVPDANISWDFDNSKWQVTAQGKPITASLDTKCAGMAEPSQDALGRQYVEELRKNSLATTLIYPDEHIAFTILPWRGDDTKLVAYHELGHAMGLGDVLADVPFIDVDQKKSKEANLMFYQMQAGYEGHRLRLRRMPIKDNNDATGFMPSIGDESQWDCLQRKSPEKSCVYQKWAF
ncbi:MAG: hypothetical protein LBH25_09710 [Fibromonadaceae bacterium]|jgi:hypothetical protein|nr:hypothetical protein [Fibromonadaceae bacterium]